MQLRNRAKHEAKQKTQTPPLCNEVRTLHQLNTGELETIPYRKQMHVWQQQTRGSTPTALHFVGKTAPNSANPNPNLTLWSIKLRRAGHIEYSSLYGEQQTALVFLPDVFL